MARTSGRIGKKSTGGFGSIKMVDQYADKIKGPFSFFDRMIINGYFRPFLSERMRSHNEASEASCFGTEDCTFFLSMVK